MLGTRTYSGGTRRRTASGESIGPRWARSPARRGNSINLSFARMILSDVLCCTVPPYLINLLCVPS